MSVMTKNFSRALPATRALPPNSVESAGGFGGSIADRSAPIASGGASSARESDPTVLNLCKPGDMAMVHRAVVAGWPVPQATRDAVCDQIDGAIEHYANPGTARTDSQFIKLVKLMLAMDQRNLIEIKGVPRSKFPNLRKRNPEKRQCRNRALSFSEREQIQAAREFAKLAKFIPVPQQQQHQE